MFGALIFQRLAYAIGTKSDVLVSLIIWSGVVIYGYGFLQTTRDAWAMAAVIGIVMGGSQALSRSLFSRMIPAGREASFFGLYEVSERGTWSLRPSDLRHRRRDNRLLIGRHYYRLIALFVIGTIILYFTDTDRAMQKTGNLLPEEAAKVR